VTTNHVAAHLKISPGNLYYHFRNKEEILREAFERMNAEADAVWKLEALADGEKKPPVDPTALQRMLVGNLTLYARYVFLRGSSRRCSGAIHSSTSGTRRSQRSASISSNR
jgi:AcrR family transcriptional regulator